MKKIIPVFLLILLLAAIVQADTIRLHTGEKIDGKVTSMKDGKIILSGGKKIDAADVAEINFLKAGKAKTGNAVYAAKDVNELLAMAKAAEKKFPGSKAIQLIDHGTDTFLPEGTQSHEYHFAGLVLNESMTKWADNSFWVEPEKNRVEIIMARSIQPDGSISNLDLKTISTTAAGAEDADSFGELKYQLKTFTIPDVKVGSIVEMIYRIESFNTYDKNQWYPAWYFGSEIPVVDSKIEFIAPKNIELNWYLRNMPEENAKPKITDDGKFKHYVWQMKNVAPFVNEPDAPADGELLPSVKISVFKDMSYLHEWLGKMIKRRIVLTDEIKNFTLDLVKDAKNDEEKIAKIYHYIQRQIRYLSIKGSISSGLAGHEAYHTFKNKYGDCIDKSILFATMLKAVNIEAYPVIVKTNDAAESLTPKIPVLDGNHAINEIHFGGRVFYLDTTATDYRYPAFRGDDQGIYAWNPILKQQNLIHVIDPKYNTREALTKMKLDYEGGADVEEYIKYSGDQEAWLRAYFKYLKPEQMKMWLQGIVNSDSPGSTLTKYNAGDGEDLSKPLTLDLFYQMKTAAKQAGNLLIMKMPVSYSIDGLSLEKRRWPVKYTTSAGKKNHVEIMLPKNYKVRYVPENISIKNEYMSYEAKFTKKNDMLVFEDHYQRFKTRIPAKDYAEYKAAAQKMLEFLDQPVVLEHE